MTDRAVPRRIVIVTAVYNDWTACARLLAALDAVIGELGRETRVVIVDDGSTDASGRDEVRDFLPRHIAGIELLELVANLGNQRALAVGLSVTAESTDDELVVVMDADGEDRPEDFPGLLARAREAPGHIVVAARKERSEGAVFRLLYLLYKVLFRVLTGHRIAFGNFCLIPSPVLRRLVYFPELWNNLAACVRRSRFPIRSLDTRRGQRYAGQSSTSLVGLILHGLSAVSVYSDVAFVRVLLFSVLLALCTGAGILVAIGLRIWTDLPIPGWTTTVVASLSIILLQALLLSGGAVFLLLSQRSSPAVVPALVARRYVSRREPLVERPTGAETPDP